MRPVDILVRLEWAAVFVAAVLLYWWLGAPWWLFALLILAPDLSMAGYLAGPRAGAVAYNAFHALLGPLALAAAGLVFPLSWAFAVATVWLAHIALDRALGYGLKRATGFSDTHMGTIGAARSRHRA